jgi:hypothetical protein
VWPKQSPWPTTSNPRFLDDLDQEVVCERLGERRRRRALLIGRKKLRGASDAETLRDVRLGLAVARLLLDDRRASLDWERCGSGKVGPDFTLTIPGVRPVNLELTRMRRVPEHVEPGVPWLAKLRQLPPSMPNAIVVAIGGSTRDGPGRRHVRPARPRSGRREGRRLFGARGSPAAAPSTTSSSASGP